MVIASPQRYLLSCGLLVLPIFAWNAVLGPYLPAAFAVDAFWTDIPAVLGAIENSSRIALLATPFLMPLELRCRTQQRGFFLFAAGSVLYFISWLPLLLAPGSPWSTSVFGFLAPAYAPLIWLVGLALLGRRLFWGTWYRWWMYLIGTAVFIAAHVGHAALIYSRLSP